MTSVFDTEFAACAPDLLAVYGDSITYTAADGTATSLTAIVGGVETVDQVTDQGQIQIRQRKVQIPTNTTAGSGSYVASPALNATLTIGGETWAVSKIDGPTGGIATLTVVDRASRSKNRPGYWGK